MTKIPGLNSSNILFQSNCEKRENNSKLIVGIAGCALLTPLLPIIDGDSFKTTYKNKNVLKFTTGIASIGGAYALTRVLSKKIIENSDNKKKSKMLVDTCLGAALFPAMLLVDKWSDVNKKPVSKKWYFIATLAGAGIMNLISLVQTKN